MMLGTFRSQLGTVFAQLGAWIGGLLTQTTRRRSVLRLTVYASRTTELTLSALRTEGS